MDHIEIDFPVEPFHSVPRLLLRTAILFGSNLPFIAGVTLLVFLPATLLLQFAYSLLNVPTSGILSYLLMSAGDLVLAALAVPAILYGLTYKLRDGKLPPLADSLRWGRRQWGKTLWNSFKMEVTILLYSLLLLIPGIIASIDLIFTETIVALEGDLTSDVFERTRALAHGRRWRIFFVMAPLSVLGLLGSMLVLKTLEGAANSHVLLAIADSLLTVVSQLTTVAVLLIYLGVIEAKPPAAVPRKPSGRARRAR
ncbi:conserved membrane hypothetical protein [Candidatus Sulfopaludibacter sp. SbA3]|nr:conserved membrane hypothetical protein [Candidatus Sulfopaludibacter sp. SbA3]